MKRRASRPAGAGDERELLLDDGWDALEVAKMSLGAFRHNHTAEPVASPLALVRRTETADDPPHI